MKKRWKKFMSAAMALLMVGCGKTSDPEDITTGGRISMTDHDAPKVIQSKEIVEFYASFFLYTRWRPEEHHSFVFQVKQEESGAWTASETYSETACPADETLMTALQDVIDRYELASMNGVCEYTAGVAPEYGECILRVTYASGETLNFTVDNYPEAEWAEMFCDVFTDWFKTKNIEFDVTNSEEWE